MPHCSVEKKIPHIQQAFKQIKQALCIQENRKKKIFKSSQFFKYPTIFLKDVALHLTKLNLLHPRMLYSKFDQHWTGGFKEDVF